MRSPRSSPRSFKLTNQSSFVTPLIVSSYWPRKLPSLAIPVSIHTRKCCNRTVIVSSTISVTAYAGTSFVRTCLREVLISKPSTSSSISTFQRTRRRTFIVSDDRVVSDTWVSLSTLSHMRTDSTYTVSSKSLGRRYNLFPRTSTKGCMSHLLHLKSRHPLPKSHLLSHNHNHSRRRKHDSKRRFSRLNRLQTGGRTTHLHHHRLPHVVDISIKLRIGRLLSADEVFVGSGWGDHHPTCSPLSIEPRFANLGLTVVVVQISPSSPF